VSHFETSVACVA